MVYDPTRLAEAKAGTAATKEPGVLTVTVAAVPAYSYVGKYNLNCAHTRSVGQF